MCLSVRNSIRNSAWSIWLSVALCPLLMACGEQAVPDDDTVEAVAKAYCEHLLQGRYRDYVMGRVDYDALPQSYVEQLVADVKMTARKQQRLHGGVSEIEAEHADVDGDQALAYLLFHYDDGTTSRVMVPMERKGRVWYLR